MPLNAFFNFVVKSPKTTIVLTLIMIGIMSIGFKNFAFKNDYRMFFSDENPQLQAFESIQRVYSKNDNVLIAIAPKDGHVFTQSTLNSIEKFTKDAWQIPYSSRVDSITNYQHTSAEEDDLLVENLVENALTLDAETLAKKRTIALNEPLLVNRLINPDASVTGINITINLPGKDPQEVVEVKEFVTPMLDKLRAENKNLEVYLTGMVIMNATFPEAGERDSKQLYPIMFLIILAVSAFMLRSFSGMVITASVIILTIIGCLGTSFWFGIVLSPPTMTVPVVIMTIAVADCVHILVTFIQHVNKGEGKEKAMLESLRVNIGPVFLTTITTAIGFLTLNYSDVPPYRELGNMTAIGVIVTFFLSITFLPALSQLLPYKQREHRESSVKFIDGLADFVILRYRPILFLMGGLVIFLACMIPRSELNDEFLKYFDETFQFRTDTDYAVTHLTGLYMMDFSVPAKGENGVTDPEYLKNLAKFATWFETQPDVLHVNVYTDIMKRLNKSLHGDDPTYYRLPENKELAAQYLLLYEFSLPYGLDLSNQINLKKSSTRMTVSINNVSTKEMIALEQSAKKWQKENLPSYMQSEGTGPSLMFSYIGQRNIRFMLKGTIIALILISGILLFALKSVKIGLISLVPNLVPAIMAFGLWGLFVGEVGLALSVVTALTLGIVVDDTIHFLSKYLRAKREKNLSTADAIRYSFHNVGRALIITSVVLVLGFLVLASSHFKLNSGMGQLTAMIIGLALFADFLLLPALLVLFGDKKNA